MTMTMAVAVAWSSTYTRIIWGVLVLALVGYLIWKGAISLEGMERIGRIADTAGGKIMILVVMALLFFVAALGVGYYCMDGIQSGTIKPDDAVAIMMIQFATGGAFGTAMGALINLLGGKAEK